MQGTEGFAQVTGQGAVTLGWPDVVPENVTIVAQAGPVDLTVPGGGYQIVVSTQGGEITLDGVYDDPEASSVLNITTITGPVTIRAAGDR